MMADLERIVEIYNATIPSRQVTADLEPISVQSRLPWFHAHDPRRRPLWVAQSSAGVEGWLSLSTFYDRAAYDATVEVSVYVDERSRATGLGSLLLTHAIAQAPALGIDTLIGYVYRHNPQSLRLFHRHGFQRWGLLPGVTVLDRLARDVVILGRKVTEQISNGGSIS